MLPAFTPKQKTITGILLCFVLPLTAILISTQMPRNSVVASWSSRLMLWLALALVYLYTFKTEQRPLLLWKETKQSFWHYCIAVVCIYVGIMICSVVIGKLLSLAGLLKPSAKLKEMLVFMRQHKLLLVFTCLTAAIMEELLFRGYLMPRLQELLKSKAAAVILSALMFGALHFGYGTIVNVVGPFVIGIIFGLYYQQYRNLKVLMVCHFLIDFVALSFQKA